MINEEFRTQYKEIQKQIFNEPKWKYFSQSIPSYNTPLVVKFRLKNEEQFRSQYFLGYLADEPTCVCPFNNIIDNIKVAPSQDYYEKVRNFIYSNEIELEAYLELPYKYDVDSDIKPVKNPL